MALLFCAVINLYVLRNRFTEYRKSVFIIFKHFRSCVAVVIVKRIAFDFLIVSAVIYKHVFTVIGRETVMSRSVLLILLARFKYRLVALMPRLYIKQIAVFISPKHSHTVSPTCIGRRICNDNFTVSDKYRRAFIYFKSPALPNHTPVL